MSEHTPTPWMTDNVDVFALDDEGFRAAKVCHLTNNSRDGVFIVRACNAHDDLVEALEEIAAWAGEFTHGDDNLQSIVRGRARIARAALSKAKATP